MSTYELALREVARQVQAIGTDRLFSDEIQVRELNWEDVVKVGGITIRYDFGAIRERQEASSERDNWGYPAFFVMCQGWSAQLAEEQIAGSDLVQSVTRYFHNRRRMSAAQGPGVNEQPCVVTAGPKPPNKYSDKKIITRTIWCWFMEPRATANYPA